MISTIIMDLDGSTITKDNTLPKALEELILCNKNINWVIATGRSFKSVLSLPLIDCLHDKATPHILENGSRIADLSGRIFYEHLLTDSELDVFFASIILDNTDYIFYSIGTAGGFLWTHAGSDYRRLNLAVLRYTDDIDTFKSWCYRIKPAKLALFKRKDAILEQLDKLNWVINGSHIDITTKNIDKGSGCISTLALLNEKPENALFIFNDHNDLPVLTKLPEIHTLKVGHALPGVSADYTASAPDEVASILYALLSKRRESL